MTQLGELILTDNYGQTYQITAPSAQIGSSPQCAVVLDEPGIKEIHAEVAYEGNAWILRGLYDEAGLVVNDQQVQITQPLNHGDVITIGNAVLRVSIPASEPSPVSTEDLDVSVQHGSTEDFSIYRTDETEFIKGNLPPSGAPAEDKKRCRACNRLIHPEAEICPHCGVRQTAPPGPDTPAERGKSRVKAGVLGILLGSFGAHKFYLGQTALGILYLVFFWAYIPGIIGLIEGISYLIMSDEAFAKKYK